MRTIDDVIKELESIGYTDEKSIYISNDKHKVYYRCKARYNYDPDDSLVFFRDQRYSWALRFECGIFYCYKGVDWTESDIQDLDSLLLLYKAI